MAGFFQQLRMRGRLYVVGLLLALVAVMSTRLAQAEQATTSSNESRRAEAQAHFERGLRLANVSHDWEGALVEFLASRRVFATRSATHNAAIALRELGRYAEALEMYETLRREFAASVPPEQLASARADEQALRQRVGSVEIGGGEAGTVVTIDGRHYGTTPLGGPVRLDIGEHTLRLSKEGFKTLERQIRVVPQAAVAVTATLDPLDGAGVLAISEVGGEALEVVVDSAAVGVTPWRGVVAVGQHSVLLRGAGRGTAPAIVRVRLRQVVELVLQAVTLDAQARIEPKPESATIFVDGVFVGSGTWSGQLPSGRHWFEALAPGYSPFRRDVQLESGRALTIEATLSKPTPAAPFKLTGFYVEPNVGALFARSLRGDLDAACDCDERSRPLGWLASLRAGYQISRPFALELGGGYWSVSESATRTVVAHGDRSRPFTAVDYEDSVKLSGPFASVGGVARFFARTPVTTRFGAGVARLNLETDNAGTYAGQVPVQSAEGTTQQEQQLSNRLSVAEPSQALWAPLLSAELRAGYRLTRRFSFDVGLSLLLIFPQRRARADRLLAFPEDQAGAKQAGFLQLDDEVAARSFVAISPSLAGRFEL